VYATCIQCQQKKAAYRAATSKKRSALQSLDPNIQSSKHPKTCLTDPKPPDTAPIPLTPVPAQPFLHCSRCSQRFPLPSLNSRVYTTCIQCQQKDTAHRAATSKKQPALQSLGPIIQPSNHLILKPLDLAPLPLIPVPAQPLPPILRPAMLCPITPALAPPEPFLPTDEWQYI
jgi:hypothetical protein